MDRTVTAMQTELEGGEDLAEDIHQITLFLASPVYSKNLIFHKLRVEVKKVEGSEDILIYMLQLAQVCARVPILCENYKTRIANQPICACALYQIPESICRGQVCAT